LITADGWPIVWLANHAGRPIERICGADLVEPICGLAASEGFPVFFIGPGHSSQKTAISRLLSRFPKLKVVGAQSPNLPVSPEPERVAMLAEAITASQASICFISLGAPKQEFLADALSALCPHVGFLCVGAALDFISGHELRAPHWLQLARLEWLWRLCGDPRRLAGRYLLSAFELLVQIWKLIFPRRNSRKLKKIETL
jgi:exopolysaccharide biosynthesis WecB/TagA/CpsF family protein